MRDGTVVVITTEYRHEHGIRPNGTGHWAFSLKRHPDGPGDLFWFEGDYLDARRVACSHFHRLGEEAVVFLMP